MEMVVRIRSGLICMLYIEILKSQEIKAFVGYSQKAIRCWIRDF
jgi:hypothetical protein